MQKVKGRGGDSDGGMKEKISDVEMRERGREKVLNS